MADRIAERLLAALPPPNEPSASSSTTETAIPSSHSSDCETSIEATAGGDSSNNAIIQNLEKWSRELERILLSPDDDDGGKRAAATNSTTTREAANSLHRAIVTTVLAAPPPSSYDDCDDDGGERTAVDWNDDAAANEATELAADALISLFSCDDSVDADANDSSGAAIVLDVPLLAGLLRAAGLFLRWHHHSHSPHSSPSPLSSSFSRESSENPSDAASRLKSESALRLYANVLDRTASSTNATASSSSDAPRFASICLFRATYGDDVALRLLVDSPRVDGCAVLARALSSRGGKQPVPRMLATVRNVHHMIAALPGRAIPRLEGALEDLASLEEEEAGAEGDALPENCDRGLSEALIATLARTYRSEPPFPGDAADRRCDLVLETLRALYALDNAPGGGRRPAEGSMNTIGVVLCELLQFSNADDRVYQIKLSVVALLLNAPEAYGRRLANGGGVPPLVDVLSRQTSLVVVERRGSTAEDAAAVVPVLLALLKIVRSDESALRIVKDAVFPPDAEESFLRNASVEIAKGATDGKSRARNMAPLDAPPGTLRWRLIRLMTWLDSNVKRAACELLWALCDDDPTAFVLRTGFGNAVHFLGIRGHVNLPAGAEA